MSIEEIVEILTFDAEVCKTVVAQAVSVEAREKYKRRASAFREAIALLKSHPDAQPHEPLTLDELRGMDGQPVWGADGKCYIINLRRIDHEKTN